MSHLIIYTDCSYLFWSEGMKELIRMFAVVDGGGLMISALAVKTLFFIVLVLMDSPVICIRSQSF